MLSLAVREAVTNVIRHARATRCDLRLTVASSGGHTLILADNGVAHGGTPHREGNGLRGMRERVAGLGGALGLVASASGTTLEIRLPISASGTMGALRESPILPSAINDPASAPGASLPAVLAR